MEQPQMIEISGNGGCHELRSIIHPVAVYAAPATWMGEYSRIILCFCVEFYSYHTASLSVAPGIPH
jgi:hypothetical protein